MLPLKAAVVIVPRANDDHFSVYDLRTFSHVKLRTNRPPLLFQKAGKFRKAISGCCNYSQITSSVAPSVDSCKKIFG